MNENYFIEYEESSFVNLAHIALIEINTEDVDEEGQAKVIFHYAGEDAGSEESDLFASEEKARAWLKEKLGVMK